MESPQTDPLAIAAVACGLLSWMLGCCGMFFGPFGILAMPLAIMAVIFGALSIRRVNADPALFTGKEIGIAGLVMGGLNLLLSLVIIGLLVLGVGGALLASVLGNSGY